MTGVIAVLTRVITVMTGRLEVKTGMVKVMTRAIPCLYGVTAGIYIAIPPQSQIN